MDKHQYFMAHAPAEPQPWFKPEMSQEPKTPLVEDIVDQSVREDVQFAIDNRTDAATEEGKAFLVALRAAEEVLHQWVNEREKQRYVQWPAAWADAVLTAPGKG